MTRKPTRIRLRADQAALVVDEDGGLTVYIPDLPEGTNVPRMYRLIAAVAAKADDPDWVEQTIAVLEGPTPKRA